MLQVRAQVGLMLVCSSDASGPSGMPELGWRAPWSARKQKMSAALGMSGNGQPHCQLQCQKQGITVFCLLQPVHATHLLPAEVAGAMPKQEQEQAIASAFDLLQGTAT